MTSRYLPLAIAFLVGAHVGMALLTLYVLVLLRSA